MFRKTLLNIFFLFCVVSAFGKCNVQSCFLNCCFGESKRNVQGKLDKKYKTDEHNSSLIINEVWFGGVKFDAAILHFCSMGFYCIEFYAEDNSITRKLHEIVIDKYDCFVIGEHASTCDDYGRSVYSGFMEIEKYGYILTYKNDTLKEISEYDEL